MRVKQRPARAQPLPPPYAYPEHCGRPTTLRVFGWHCATCGVYTPFRDAQGRTWNQIRLHTDQPLEKE